MEIIYEDNHIVVCFKPCGVLSQQDDSNDLDMLRMVKDYIKIKYNKPNEAFIGLVHRLDRNTEGIMVFARTSKAAARLSESIKTHDFHKSYLAVLEGHFNEIGEEGQLKDLLVKNENTNTSYVDKKNGKEAILKYKVLDIISLDNKDYTLVAIDLLTGRHHQIRVQFSSRGYPLYGDVKYGSKNKVGNYYALSSYYLSFPHPTIKDIRKYYYFVPENIFKEFYAKNDFLEKYKLK